MTTSNHPDPTSEQDDILWDQLKALPAFRALLRSVETRFYHAVDLPKPILDIGSGDGHFADTTFSEPLDVGIDPWWGPMMRAQEVGAHTHLIQCMGDTLPFPSNHFGSVISNSVLEHIPDVQAVLNDAGRVLRPGGKLLITMPSHHFTEYLGGAGFFERLGLDGLAERYRTFFNFISRHEHTDSAEVWAERLAQAGFVIERWQYYFSQEALRALEFGHVQGAPSAIIHALTGHWIIAPWRSSLKRTEQWVRPFFEEPFPKEGAYVVFVARKEGDGPVEARLPEQRPFSIEELTQRQTRNDKREMINEGEEEGELTIVNEEETGEEELLIANESEASNQPINQSTNQPNRQSSIVNPSTSLRPSLKSILLIICLLAAYFAQTTFAAAPEQVGSGLGWLLISGLSLLGLLWQPRAGERRERRLSLPNLAELPRRRWLFPLALLLAGVGYRLGSSTTAVQRPNLAILLWLLAIGIGIYAFWGERAAVETAAFPRPATNTLLITLAFFVVALLTRLVSLGSHPFILNGTEASLGQNVVAVTQGFLTNPFGAGWLTNPTLPSFVQALPVRLLGVSPFSLRLLSAVAGALTVALIYLVGKTLWRQEVGIIAALLLFGSHLHLHYSRMALTNVWDGLLILAALGLGGLAWRHNLRSLWLLAGVALGLNAYLFTAVRLLPLILLPIALLIFLSRREQLETRWRGLTAALLIGLLVALPQLLFYNANPDIFWERLNILGIFQSGWLAREVEITGRASSAILSEQLWRGFLAFNAGLDRSPSYGAQIPLLSTGTAVLLLIGVITAVFRRNSLRNLTLLLWLGVTLLVAAALLENPPHSHRLVSAMPAVALLGALGLSAIGERFSLLTNPPNTEYRTPNTEGRSALRPYAPLLLFLIPLLFAANDLVYYFGPFRVDHRFADRNTEIADEVADYLNTLDPDTWSVYFYGAPAMYADFPTIPLLASEFRRDVNLFDVTEPQTAVSVPTTPNAAYIYLPERLPELVVAQQQFPNGTERPISGYYASPLFVVYEVQP